MSILGLALKWRNDVALFFSSDVFSIILSFSDVYVYEILDRLFKDRQVIIPISVGPGDFLALALRHNLGKKSRKRTLTQESALIYIRRTHLNVYIRLGKDTSFFTLPFRTLVEHIEEMSGVFQTSPRLPLRLDINEQKLRWILTNNSGRVIP